MKTKNKIFIYLARRDKKGVKVLTSFSTKLKCYPMKIDSHQKLIELGMSREVTSNLYKEFNDNKMFHEMWIESASEYKYLKESLVKRGYRNLPMQETNFYIANNVSRINKNSLLDKSKTMLRKKS